MGLRLESIELPEGRGGATGFVTVAKPRGLLLERGIDERFVPEAVTGVEVGGAVDEEDGGAMTPAVVVELLLGIVNDRFDEGVTSSGGFVAEGVLMVFALFRGAMFRSPRRFTSNG